MEFEPKPAKKSLGCFALLLMGRLLAKLDRLGLRLKSPQGGPQA